ncbi:MAG: FAD-linked oxidase C-terminal domain-containing protein [Bacteroidota bacterium]
MSALHQSLRQAIRGEVLTDETSLGLYSTDASVYQIRPLAVVCPWDEADVKAAIKITAEHQVSILPRGGGTSLAGQTVGRSLVLDFSKHLNQVIELNVEEQWVRVQPGMVRDELNAFLAPHGLHFAPDPATSSRANVGGMVGNNSSGTKSILYGKTVDHVLEAKVLLADGTEMLMESLDQVAYQAKCEQTDREGDIYRGFAERIHQHREEIEKRFPKVMRRVGGYNLDEFIHTEDWNLAKLITGSEGTLATTLELKLNLVPLPRYKSVCVVHYAELMEAIQSVTPMLAFRPAAIEILDDTVVRLSRENLTTQRACHFIEGDPAAILIVEFYSDDEADVRQRPLAMIAALKKKGLGYAYPFFTEGPEYDDVWLIRKKGLGLMLGIKGEKKPLAFIEDAGIPTDVLPEYIDKVLAVCKKHGTEAAMYAHASVGVIHVRPILDLRQAIDIERFEAIARDTFELVQHYGGSWSGEHGDGLVRSPFNREYFGETLYGVFKEIKALFDPENRMNPGKIVDAPPMRENLRYGTTYQDQSPKTHFRYPAEGSFDNAVHMCTGVGECRKIGAGTMCPSFKATRKEEDSTRGRANALRLAMSGQLEEGLGSERIQEVMDLCLSCKACKSECPSNVDMARLKGEVRQQYYDEHGPSLRDRMIRDSAKMAKRFAGEMAGLINNLQGGSLFKLVQSKLLGFDSRRTLPSYTAEPFEDWFAQQKLKTAGPRIALFADTYLNYHEPVVGKAAYKLLTSLGYQVELAAVGCCQRPKISHGFLREAASEGQKMAQSLDYWLREGVPVLVCEPSCASALVDDLPDLLGDPALGERLSQGIKPIENFLLAEQASGNISLSFSSEVESLLIHGHCHQKALFGMEALQKLFEASDTKAEIIDAGCCGMAGSFGYEKEHYHISAQIGEQKLFPAIRERQASAQVAACGFSCRHQIEHFTGVQAKHWLEYINHYPLF